MMTEVTQLHQKTNGYEQLFLEENSADTHSNEKRNERRSSDVRTTVAVTASLAVIGLCDLCRNEH